MVNRRCALFVLMLLMAWAFISLPRSYLYVSELDVFEPDSAQHQGAQHTEEHKDSLPDAGHIVEQGDPHLDAGDRSELQWMSMGVAQDRVEEPVHTEEHGHDTQAGNEINEGALSMDSHDKLYIVLGRTLHPVPACHTCGSPLDLCSLGHEYPRVKWSVAKTLPVGVPFDCQHPPLSIINHMALFVFNRVHIIRGDDDVVYYVYQKKAVRLGSCLECGVFYGSICDIKMHGNMPTSVLATLGNWPVPKKSPKRLADIAPVFSCGRDAVNFQFPPLAKNWFLLTSPHLLSMARLIQQALLEVGYNADTSTHPPESYAAYGLCIVLGSVAFKNDDMPPAAKRIVVQLEQKSSTWFTKTYSAFLKDSYAVLEYNMHNIDFLREQGVSTNVWYVPIGGNKMLLPPSIQLQSAVKKWDLVFFGDLRSERRKRFLNIVSKRFKVKVVTETFGQSLIDIMKQARFVLNIHYYLPPLLEVFRIYESLSHGIPIISEDAPDSWMYPELQDVVHFFKLDSADSMLDVIDRALKTSDQEATARIPDVVARSHVRFSFMFKRFLFGMGQLPWTHVDEVIKQNTLIFSDSPAEPIILSIPETPRRRMGFLQSAEHVRYASIFDGMRHLMRPPWQSAALSYSVIAKLALRANVGRLAVAEDDVVFPSDFSAKARIIDEYLDSLGEDWVLFSGLIADVHVKTTILSAQMYKGIQFITIDKMVSMVYNVYSKSALHALADWNPNDDNVFVNTIDRYLERKKKMKVVVALPFLVGHREDAYSTLWSIKNKQYSKMIFKAQRKLEHKLRLFQEKSGARQ
eukprot:TRINITY_DN6567_c1_g1_i3.p1 TRINITY_DN6567_c1_g1~~TRINITY_DN6567_c1_g1_i3.p1  ORF type:complete len:801 (+),score=103.56 TRINITY_DN6567_c1_g1_i3:51-2453(+)